MDSTSNINLIEVVETDGESSKDTVAYNDSEYDASEEEDEDESTIAEQELLEREVDHADELNTLHKEGTCEVCIHRCTHKLAFVVGVILAEFMSVLQV